MHLRCSARMCTENEGVTHVWSVSDIVKRNSNVHMTHSTYICTVLDIAGYEMDLNRNSKPMTLHRRNLPK